MKSIDGAGRSRLIRAAMLLLGAMSIASCATRGGDIPYAPVGFGLPDRASINTLPYTIPLGPLDQIKINVFRVPDLSGDYQVGGDGMLVMPLIGSVDVRDMSAEQAAGVLEQRYAAKYLNSPSITLRVVTTSQRDVVVEGGVRNPGVFPINGSTTLLGIIAQAKGINPDDGNARRVAIFRRIDGRMAAAAFDVIDIRRGKMEDPRVYPGDTVVVDSSSLRSIYRDVITALPTLTIFNAL